MLEPIAPGVLVGNVAPLGAGGLLSGIDKHLVAGPWRIGATGIKGDAQGPSETSRKPVAAMSVD